ncbi:hypothetical protein B0H12DRAFT_1080423 [Mycena haematopus]|nr:hypothetical protein B0H12DRAFT_1080423 [Mycena haematopus]
MAPRIHTAAERTTASADRASRLAKRASSAPLPDVPPAPLPPTGSASLIAILEHDATPADSSTSTVGVVPATGGMSPFLSPVSNASVAQALKPARSTPASTSSSVPISAAVVEAAFRKVSAPKPLSLHAPAEQAPSGQAPTKPTLATTTSTNESTLDAAALSPSVPSPTPARDASGGEVPAAPAIVDGGMSTVHGSEATPIDVDTPTTPTMPANGGNGVITATRTTPDGFPALPVPSPNIQSHAALRKEKKDKGKGKAAPPPRSLSPELNEVEDHSLAGFFSQQDAEEARDPILAAQIAREESNARTARPRFRTADGNPPRGSYTPIPEDEWRLLFGIDGESIWRNHPEAQRAMWDNEPHPKFLAIVSGGNGDRTLTQRAIATAIANYVNVDVDEVSVGPPALGTGSGPDARAWLIGGLPTNLAHAVLDARVLCCTEITLFLVQYSPPINGFLGAITGFTLRNTRAGTDKACEHIGNAMKNDPAISRFVRSHRDVFPPHIGEDEALDLFTLSIGVRGIDLLLPGNAGTYVAWNVYVMTPTDIVKDFNELRRLFSLLVIVTSFNGEGRIHPSMSCNLCPCTDHATPICPYPGTPGWLGATPATIGALLENSRAARALRK